MWCCGCSYLINNLNILRDVYDPQTHTTKIEKKKSTILSYKSSEYAYKYKMVYSQFWTSNSVISIKKEKSLVCCIKWDARDAIIKKRMLLICDVFLKNLWALVWESMVNAVVKIILSVHSLRNLVNRCHATSLMYLNKNCDMQNKKKND